MFLILSRVVFLNPLFMITPLWSLFVIFFIITPPTHTHTPGSVNTTGIQYIYLWTLYTPLLYA